MFWSFAQRNNIGRLLKFLSCQKCLLLSDAKLNKNFSWLLKYLDIILCLKVIAKILQIEWIKPFKEWMIQSKSDVGFTSNGSCQLPWKLQNTLVAAQNFTFGRSVRQARMIMSANQFNPLTPVPAVIDHCENPPPISHAGRNQPWKSMRGQLPFLPSLKRFWSSYCSIVVKDK